MNNGGEGSWMMAQKAMTVAFHQAAVSGATRTETRVLAAVVSLLSGWCKLADTIAHSQIAEAACIGGTPDTRRTTIWRALNGLQAHGILTVTPGANRHKAAVVGYSQSVRDSALALLDETTVGPVDNRSTVAPGDNAGPDMSGSSVADSRSSVADSPIEAASSVASGGNHPRKNIQGFSKATTGAASFESGGAVAACSNCGSVEGERLPNGGIYCDCVPNGFTTMPSLKKRRAS